MTRYAHRLTGRDDVTVFHDGWWALRLGRVAFPLGPTLTVDVATIEQWRGQAQQAFADAEDYWFFDYRPAAGDTVLDVGAGRGEDTFIFSRAVGSEGRVIAVEADPDSCDYLRWFCAFNRLDNVRVVHAAVAGHDGTCALARGRSWVETTLVEVADGPHEDTIPVAAVTLDTICHEHGIARIDLLKMNIEGAEALALTEDSDALRVATRVCIACHDFRAERGEASTFRTREKVERTLHAAGFHVWRRVDDPRPYVRDHVHGTKPIHHVPTQ